MITVETNQLVFRFPEVHVDATCEIEFQRTLRIPDNGKEYPLPPALERFRCAISTDFAPRVPEKWARARRCDYADAPGQPRPCGSISAVRRCFDDEGYPFAVKVATGKINAVTGEGWINHLNVDPQDYLVLPRQPWLDGYCVEKGSIRQFVAMPLGEGCSAEEQMTGAGEHGGVQIIVHPMKAARYQELQDARRKELLIARH